MRALVVGTGLGLAALLAVAASSSPVGLTDRAQRLEGRGAGRTELPRTVEVVVRDEVQLRRAWADPLTTRIRLANDVVLRDCLTGDPVRESPYPVLVDGRGHTLRQSCFEKRLLRQDGSGPVALRAIRLTRGGSDGPGAALTARGEVTVDDSVVESNLAEEPGGGIFSMRRAVVRHSRIGGNLANDDGGGVYARRGGVQVYDSVLSHNLVDGSGGAVASTGDIRVVRSYVDGNTTDGDGGALYADEDGDVTVIDSLVDGSDADGPGGAIFTLDGDVAVVGSTLIGNRADDRGGAIAGEADVLIVGSTLARNQAVAHVGGAAWARGNLMLVSSTVTDNYAEGEGGGVLAAGRTTILSSTVTANIASVAANAGSGEPLVAFGSIIGPAVVSGNTGDTRPTNRSCRVYDASSLGYNFITDDSCELDASTEVRGGDPRLSPLEADPDGFVLRPREDSPVRGRIPSGRCSAPMPAFVPAGQLLTRDVRWPDVLARDAVGTLRDQGRACDIGAVQALPPGARPRRVPFAPGPRVRFGEVIGEPPTARTTPSDRRAEQPSDAAGPAPQDEPAPTVDPEATPAELASVVGALSATVARLERAAARWPRLRSCLTYLPVDQDGDPRHRWGYRYDERDGTGIDLRTALARHRGAGRAELLLPRLDRRRTCLSGPQLPVAPDEGQRVGRVGPSVPALLAATRALGRRVAAVDRTTEDFDTWESCLSWLPVTEGGDDEQDLGYLRASGAGAVRHGAALDVDRSEWDDPDYQLLAFVGDARPGAARCEDDPGEDADRVPSPSDETDLVALRTAVAALADDVGDLAEPVEEITTFDGCMFTVGVRERAGYEVIDERGVRSTRPALAFDLSGPRLPQHDVLAFPGEEAPQIECDEDAGGVDTDE